jgi:HSP20 family protein
MFEQMTTWTTKFIKDMQKGMNEVFKGLEDDFFDEEDSKSKDYKIERNENQNILKISLPGVKKDNVKIDFKDQVLTVEVDFSNSESLKVGSRKYSFRFGDVDDSKIKSSLKDGVLKIVLGKKASGNAKNIPID